MVRLAGEHGVPLVPQGGNTSMVGGATPPADGSALILSLRRMNRIRNIDPAAGLALAEAGVILANLHDSAEQQGMRFPLTLGARGSATIGGLVSTNAGGTQVLRFGTMRSLIAGIEAVLPDGSIYDGLRRTEKGQSRLRSQPAADRRGGDAGRHHGRDAEIVAGCVRPGDGLACRRIAGGCAQDIARDGGAVGHRHREFRTCPEDRPRPCAEAYPGHALAFRRAAPLADPGRLRPRRTGRSPQRARSKI